MSDPEMPYGIPRHNGNVRVLNIVEEPGSKECQGKKLTQRTKTDEKQWKKRLKEKIIENSVKK